MTWLSNLWFMARNLRFVLHRIWLVTFLAIYNRYQSTNYDTESHSIKDVAINSIITCSILYKKYRYHFDTLPNFRYPFDTSYRYLFDTFIEISNKYRFLMYRYRKLIPRIKNFDTHPYFLLSRYFGIELIEYRQWYRYRFDYYVWLVTCNLWSTIWNLSRYSNLWSVWLVTYDLFFYTRLALYSPISHLWHMVDVLWLVARDMFRDCSLMAYGLRFVT